MILTNTSSPASADGLAPDASSKSNHALAPGFRLNEYEIVRVLGQGGFGIVYLANDATLGRQVAIKEYLPVALAARSADSINVVPRSASANKRFQVGLKAFVQEARLLARFDHPALVSIHRFWEGNGTSYMVMPYYEGRTLMETRQALGRPPTEAWLRVTLTSILGALDLLHKANCVHRDISPENILVLNDGRTVLLDFAVLPVSEDSVGQHTTILKPAWAPIEQFAQSTHLPQGPWSDIYSLGAVAYYCVTGHAPPPATVRALDPVLGRAPLAQAMQEVQAQHADVHYPPYLLEAIDWALSVRPADRPQDAQALRQMLARHKLGDEAAAAHAAPDMAVDPEATVIMPGPQRIEPRLDAAPSGRPAAASGVGAGAAASGMGRPVPGARGPSSGHAGPASAATSPQPERASAFQAAAGAGKMGADQGSAAPTAGIDASIRDAIGAALQGFDNVRNTPPASLPSIGGLDDDTLSSSGPASAPYRAQQAQAQARTARAYGAAKGQPKRSLPWQAVVAAVTMVVAMTAWIALPQWQSAREESRLGDGPSAVAPVPAAPAFQDEPARADTLPDRSAPAPATAGVIGAAGVAGVVKDSAQPLDKLPATATGRPTATDSTPVRAAPPAEAALPPAAIGVPRDAGGGSAAPARAAPAEKKSTDASGTVAKAATGSAVQSTSTVRRVEAGTRAAAAVEPPDTATAEVVADGTPRGACGNRTNFALQRCMQSQCQMGKFVLHPQCSRLRAAGGEWTE